MLINRNMQKRISTEDMEHIASSLGDVIPLISNARIFITGGTGFFGKWILETLMFLNKEYKTNCTAKVLTRNPEKFLYDFPLFNDDSITFLKSDIKTFTFPEDEFQYCIHAALEAASLDQTDELEIVNAAFQGTHRVLEFAKQKNVLSTLFVSSGGVYGRQPPDIQFIKEDFYGAPDPMQLRTCYGEGKRISEYICTYYGKKQGLSIKIARPFAFVGPYLPLDAHFVIGNFINNGLKKVPLLIKGDGTPVRSYMYAADLVVYLFKILIHGEDLTPYNVGSMEAIAISELAKIVGAQFSDQPEIIIKQRKIREGLPERYVPDSTLCASKFGAGQMINLSDAIKRTITFNS